MVYPIGHYDTPHISKFGKLYKVFEHMFILKRGDLMHMFRWFFYWIWITWNDIVTCGPFEGVLACLCKSLTGESLILEAQAHLDLHLGQEAHRLDDAPPLLWIAWMRDASFGGT